MRDKPRVSFNAVNALNLICRASYLVTLSACAIDRTHGLRPPRLLLLLLLLIVWGRESAGAEAAVFARADAGLWRAVASAAAAIKDLGGAKCRGVAAGAGDAEEAVAGALS